jgi:hypothetical protein
MIQSSEGTVRVLADTAPARTYAERLAEGILAYQRCAACESAVFYPRVICPVCGSTDLAWNSSAGLGTVYSVTAVSRRDDVPYTVCLVDLDEGFRMMSTVVGVPADQVRIGQRVRGWVDTTGDEPRPVFGLEEAQ